MHWRMDAAVTVNAQNAPTATWKTAPHAVSHRAHTHGRQRASHTKNLTLPTVAVVTLPASALRIPTPADRPTVRALSA
jgi:hypothetical protein